MEMAMTQNFVRVATDEKKSDFLRYKTVTRQETQIFDVSLLKGYH
jgi:hypothetical protein